VRGSSWVRISLTLVPFLQQRRSIELSPRLKGLLVSYSIWTSNLDFHVTCSEECNSFGVEIESFFDPVEHPGVAGAFLDDSMHEVFRAVGAKTSEEFCEGVPDLVSFLFIQDICIIGIIPLHNGDAPCSVLIVGYPSFSGAIWQESGMVSSLGTACRMSGG
jgi:hypothetical protein